MSVHVCKSFYFATIGCALTIGLTACASGSLAPAALNGTRPLAAVPFELPKLAAGPSAFKKGVTPLYVFHNIGGDGADPTGGVIVDGNGNIFGTTPFGGSAGGGSVYELQPSGMSYSFSSLYSFVGSNGDFPLAVPAEDANHNLFATAYYGGPNEYGSAVELSPKGDGYVQKRLYLFDGTTGSFPYDAILDRGQSVYTAVRGGGAKNAGAIVSFSAATFLERDLYDFQGAPDGEYPYSNLVADAKGALYGTTQDGGSANRGIVFKFVPTLAGGTETVLWRFGGGKDGANPGAPVILDEAGNIYGTTIAGGSAKEGVVFKLTPGSGGYTETILHTFTGPPDGIYPYTGLTKKGDLLYGETSVGGDAHCILGTIPGCGTIFKVSTIGTQYAVVHTFEGAADGAEPMGGSLFLDDTVFYGTATTGGDGDGIVFRFVP
jgi:uncharacterized repeat protein (TIGR03803 family)